MSRHLVVEADGGSRGNPGAAGFGTLVRDPSSGEVLAEVAEALGTATNNVAEYRGLIAGLRAAAAIDAGAAVEARLDSKLVVEQMSGRWRIKHPDLRPLAREAHDIATRFASVVYRWVPRAENTHADRLANEAMDAAARGAALRRDSTPTRPETGRNDAGSAAEPSSTENSTTGWGEPDTDPTRAILLRHGQTTLSLDRRFAGVGDVELTELGHEQAAAAAERLARRGIDVIVSSPLRRCHDTASYVAKALSLPVETVEAFQETDFGAWEGYTFSEVRQRWPEELGAWLTDPETAPPGGESFAEVARRVGAARDELAARYPGQTVLIVTHVTPIKSLVRQALLAPPEALYRMHLDVACLTEVHYFRDGPAVVRSLNDTAHLARSE